MNTIKDPHRIDPIEVRDAILRPIFWLKGKGPADTFRVGQQGFDCGAYPYWSQVEGEIGSVLVVFATGSSPTQQTVFDVIPVADIAQDDPCSLLPRFQ